MENPVRVQLSDFIGRRKITKPQFITAETMDEYFTSISVDGQREIVLGLLRSSDYKSIEEEIRQKISALYNNLYVLKEPLKKRKVQIVQTIDGKKQKVPIIRLIYKNNLYMQDIVEHLKETSEETLQAVINWTISTVNLFTIVYLRNQCAGGGLENINKQIGDISTQLSKILKNAVNDIENDDSFKDPGMFASKAKKAERQTAQDNVDSLQNALANVENTPKLLKEISNQIHLWHRIALSLKANSESITSDWSTYYISAAKDESGLALVSAVADKELKVPREIEFEKSATSELQEIKTKIVEYTKLLFMEREKIIASGINDEKKFNETITNSRMLKMIFSNLKSELDLAYDCVVNTKMQIIREKENYESEKQRYESVLNTPFAIELEEVYPTDYKERRAALVDLINKGISKDQHALLRSEFNFWSMMKDKLFEKGSEEKRNIFIKKRRMVNDITPGEKFFIEYSDRLRKTIDVTSESKDGYDQFVQQDFHEMLKYLAKLYKDAGNHVRENNVEA
jgi:hypothetical protein